MPGSTLFRREQLVFTKEGHLALIKLMRQDAIGQAVASGVGMISFVIVLMLLLYLFVHVVYTGSRERKDRAKAIQRFLRTNGVYFLCLLLCDLAPALSAMCNLNWSMRNLITHSGVCNFQGAMNQFGVTGSAVFNLFLAVETFLLPVLRVRPPGWLKWIALVIGWAFPILMTVLGPVLNSSNFSFYGPTSAGCWLTFGSSNYAAWFWAVPCISLGVLLVMIVLYIGLFLSLSGTLDRFSGRLQSSHGSSSGQKSRGLDGPSSAERTGKEVRGVARKMLWFPAFYAIFSLPIIVAVLVAANGKILPHVYYVVADCLFSAVGIADVVIFVSTHRQLLLTRRSLNSLAASGGIPMTIVTFTSASAPLPYDPAHASAPHFPTLNRSPLRPVDEEEEPIKVRPGLRKDGGAWDGGDNGIWAGPEQRDQRGHARSASTMSRLERAARSEGEEDARGLRVVQSDMREVGWVDRPSVWDDEGDAEKGGPTHYISGKAF